MKDITDSLKKAGAGLMLFALTCLPLNAQKMYRENNYLFSKESRMYREHVSGPRGNNETYCAPKLDKKHNYLVNPNHLKNIKSKPILFKKADAIIKGIYEKGKMSYCDSKAAKRYYQHRHTQK
jgi:hypothetical protein